MHTCLDCPARLDEMHGNTKRCPPCRREDRREYYRRRRGFVRHTVCVECGADITRRNSNTRFCIPCRRARHRADTLAYAARRKAADPEGWKRSQIAAQNRYKASIEEQERRIFALVNPEGATNGHPR